MAVGTVAGPRITVKLPWKISYKKVGATNRSNVYALCYMKAAVAKVLGFEQAKKESDDVFYKVKTKTGESVTHYRKGTVSGKVYTVIFEKNKRPNLPSGKEGKTQKAFSSLTFNVDRRVRTSDIKEHLQDKVPGAKFLITPDGKRIDIVKTV